MICHLYPEPSYLLFVPDLALVYYSHVPVAILSLIIGIFVYLNNRNYLLNQLLLILVLLFSFWSLANLVTWTNIHSDAILFAWSFLGPLYSLISIFAVYFTYVFLEEKDVSWRTKLVFGLLLAPALVFGATSFNVSGFNIINCDAFGFEGVAYNWYQIVSGIVAMVWILVLLVRKYFVSAAQQRKKIALMGTGLEFFLFLFYATVFLAAFLTDAGLIIDSELEIYGLFGMTVFLMYIGVLMVRFNAFHSGIIASQALVVALLALIGAQFTFVSSITAVILNSVALLITSIIGVVLIRNVKKEIEQRKHIEMLAKDLAKANDQQVTLIHFITHQIKGFVTKSRNIFASLLEGDFGVIPESIKPLVQQGFDSDTKGVSTIQEILNAANIKSGKVSFIMSPFDLKGLIEAVAKDLKPAADAKGLVLNLELGTEAVTVNGDSAQLVNAYKNLIDNSIKYTPKGSVTLKLEHADGKARFTVSDTGVGITTEDMAHLFTEGGHGKESQKVNVESTGFGLYIVKNIIETHKGRVWAESEGEGKGSRFIIELPA